MKGLLTVLFGMIFSLITNAQAKKQDTLAILLIDRMTDVIGDMESCSFKLQIGRDTTTAEWGTWKRFTDCEVYMSGPDKLLVKYFNDRGHKQIMYNGEQVAYYFREEHNYGVIPAPATTIQMIDSVNKAYHIDFPAADFFYPTFTDDLLANSETLRYLGRSTLNGQECFHILATSKDITLQIWIASDAYNLPVRFAITYKNRPGNPQYEASFSDWQINPRLPDAMFDFEPPPGSTKVRIMSSTDK